MTVRPRPLLSLPSPLRLLVALATLIVAFATGTGITEAQNGVAAINSESAPAVEADADISPGHVGSNTVVFDDFVLGCCVAPQPTRGAGDAYAGRVLEGGRPDGQTVFAGHGEYRYGSGSTTVPDGTSVNVYAPHGQGVLDSVGGAIETGRSVSPYQVYGPGDQIPNYTLKTPDGLTVYSGSTTVEASTSLSELLKPGMGTCHWAACVNVRGG